MGLILSRFAWVLVLTCGWRPVWHSTTGHHSAHRKLGSVILGQGSILEILGDVQEAAVPLVTLTLVFLLSKKLIHLLKKNVGTVFYSLVCFSSLNPSGFYLNI